MEVLDGPALPSPSSLAATTPDPLNMNTPDFSLTPSTISYNNGPQSSAARPGKKRKSWGQALPEPKTNLPPRKRAKTDDEKEQRRIERIKRNRAAAHNSRERKRLEAERLEIDNNHLVQQLTLMRQQLAQRDATLAKCKEVLPGGLPQLTSEELANLEVAEDRLISTPDSFVTYETIDPRASLAPASTPGDMTNALSRVKAEPMSPSVQMPLTSAPVNPSLPLDQTQHSAAMLWDLQCQSSRSSLLWWSQIILYLVNLNIMTCYKSIMIASWTLWPTRMARMLAQLSTLTASSTSTTMTRPTMSRRTRRQTTRPTTTSPRTLTSTTLSSLILFLSLRLPAWETLAQSFLATGPQRQGISARQSALPNGESEMNVVKKEWERIIIEHQKAVKAAAATRHLNHGRSWRSGGTLGKSSSEERKDEGGIG